MCQLRLPIGELTWGPLVFKEQLGQLLCQLLLVGFLLPVHVGQLWLIILSHFSGYIHICLTSLSKAVNTE